MTPHFHAVRLMLSRLPGAAAALALGALLASAPPASAREVAGVKVGEQAVVAGVPLVLNGAGVRYKAVFKVYVAALYVPSKTESTDEAIAVQTPKRLAVTMLRDIDATELGKMFTHGIEENLDRRSLARLLPGIVRMSQVFSDQKTLRQGDGFEVSWVPATGMLVSINGRSIGEPIREPEFFQALMRIWLGANPADWKLKEALLGKRDT